MIPPRPLHGVWLGRRPYAEVYALQLSLHEHVKQAPWDVVLLLEHEPCITLGKGTKPQNLLVSAEFLAGRGVTLHTTDRGGDVTLHAPGQLVAYPIVNLNHGRKDVRRYVNGLTSALQSLVTSYGISGGTIDGKVGLWVDRSALGQWPGQEHAADPAKVAAIGVRISRWVTMHGYALNLNNDLSLFQYIVPCGIAELPVTSLQSLLPHAPAPFALAPEAHGKLAKELQLEPGRYVEHAGPLAQDAIEALLT
jgi:lipoyl(octanoyl) transferase